MLNASDIHDLLAKGEHLSLECKRCENKLRFVLGDKHAGYYGYDGNGERVYKLTGTSSIGQINSGSTKAQVLFDDAVLYPNPYIVVTQTGYTKHYYAGTERLATVIGGGGLDSMTPAIDKLSSQHDWDIVKTFYSYYQNYDPFFYQKIVSQPEKTEDISGKPSPDLDYQCRPTFLDYVDVQMMWDILLKPISAYGQTNSKTEDIYFTHSDHLGSANWITDVGGNPIQYIHYAPYGELIDNQHASGSWYDERYKFTGKERDAETGYDYFGARYYSSLSGHFVSPDPHSDARPGISSYAYCSWNPVSKIDPDGRDEFEVNWNPETKKVIIKQIENKNYDQFHIVDADGNRIASSNKYSYQTITKLRSRHWGESNLSLFNVKGDGNAEDLFNFLGSNFTEEKDSPLEWSRVMVGTSNSEKNVIGTSMKEEATGVGHYIMSHGYTIRGVDHNHPNGTCPSNKDIDNARLYHSKFPRANLRVFAGGKYISYDENTPKLPIVGVELKEIEVIGRKK